MPCVSVFNRLSSCCTAAFLPAQISLVGSSTVTEGDIFELQCTVDADTVQIHTECKQIRSYLMKNNTAVRTGAFSMKDMKATFTIHGATSTDSGQYSCVVLPSRCVQEDEAEFRGKNTVTVQVQGAGSYPTFIYSSGCMVEQHFQFNVKPGPVSRDVKLIKEEKEAHIHFKTQSFHDGMLFV